ncbi:MAG: ORF6N domain-containing protein [Erysipelotrichaceae bacterium]
MTTIDKEIDTAKSDNVQAASIKDMIFMIRGQQVMLDTDLAELYGTEVKRLNEQVKRNIDKFPEDFMFQLTREEVEMVKSQFATSPDNLFKGQEGGNRKLPYVFTEQGIYMIATILKNDIATQQSIYIMRSFKEMKHYIIENKQLFNNADILGFANKLVKHDEDIQYIKNTMVTKADIDKIMENFIDVGDIKEIVILDGQKFEAFEAYSNIYKKAKHTIYIIDDYVDTNTLSMLKKKKTSIEVIIFTDNKGNSRTKLQKREVEVFNEEYPFLKLKRSNNKCHDRFIILDYKESTEKVYHCGASSKDAGNKVCCINQLNSSEIIHKIVDDSLTHDDYQF